MAEKKYDETGGFSMIKVILSDVLPDECFAPVPPEPKGEGTPSREKEPS